MNTDRAYWAGLAWQMAEPVLRNMSEGNLKKNMLVEVSPNWDNGIGVALQRPFAQLSAFRSLFGVIVGE